MDGPEQICGSDKAVPTRLQTETKYCFLLAQLGCCAERIETHSCTLSHTAKGGLCEAPDNADLQEALQQSLSKWRAQMQQLLPFTLETLPDEELKLSYLFADNFSESAQLRVTARRQALAAQARAVGSNKAEQKSLGPLWPDNILEPLDGRKLRVGYLSADLANHPVGRFPATPCSAIAKPRARRGLRP